MTEVSDNERCTGDDDWPKRVIEQLVQQAKIESKDLPINKKPPLARILKLIVARAAKEDACNIRGIPARDPSRDLFLSIDFRKDNEIFYNVMRLPKYIHYPLLAQVRRQAGMEKGDNSGQLQICYNEQTCNMKVNITPGADGKCWELTFN
jgi:hypothetical protein